ncbi:methylsterol monooxygenase 1-like [Alligator mississippiensis]|uniref:Methylsterol monooxygenase 1-like n=1 Tax=Alligator mississippiensis TaxID=8496 RepID=A0A151M7B6_ALLMI|nr:methylsterol monooxygenase 1-like [Alligator mississippiensis]
MVRAVPTHCIRELDPDSQLDKPETWEDQWKCFKMTFYHIFTLHTPLSLAVYFYVEYANLPCDWNSMPRWYSAIAQVFGCLLIEDTWEYFTHRLLHHRRLYQYLHKVHHNFQTPFSIQATYAGPGEILIFGAGFSFGMYIFCNHLFSVWLCTVARIVQNTHVHSGYDAPWDPLRLVPFAVTSRFHDFHHMNFYGNYAPVFTWWDWLFGTNKAYQNYKARRKQKEIKEDVN